MNLYFPPEWLKAALVLTLISTWVLVGIYAYLNRFTKCRYFALWTVGWLFYALWVTSTISFLEADIPSNWDWVKLSCIGVCALFLFWGALQFNGKPRGQNEMALMVFLMLIWSYAARTHVRREFLISFPLYLILMLSSFLIAFFFLQTRVKNRYVGASILCLGFLLWGIQMAFQPFVDLSESIRPTFIVMASITQLVIAIGMIILMLEEKRGETDSLRIQLEEDARLTRRLQEEVAILERRWAENEQSRHSKLKDELRDSQLNYREAEFRFRLLVQSADEAIILGNQEGNIISWNPAAEKIFGWSEREIMKKPFVLVMPERHRDVYLRQIERLKSGDEDLIAPSKVELHGLRKEGREFPMEFSLYSWKSAGKTFFGIIIRDITERKSNERRLEKQAQLLDHAREMIMVIDETGRVAYWNRSAEQVYGWDRLSAIGKKTDELFSSAAPPGEEEILALVQKNGQWLGEQTLLTRMGQRLIVESCWTLIHDPTETSHSILRIDSEITEKKELEARIARIQRMESLGALAGGIAHDLNNVITPIVMSAGLLAKHSREEGEQKLLENILSSAAHGGEVIKQIQIFARESEGENAEIQLKHIFREVEQILRHAAAKIQTTWECGNSLATIRCDPDQIHQALLNLCLYACESMPEGGKLRLSLKEATLGEKDCVRRQGSHAGKYAVVSIADSGPGMPPEKLERIFEPFYSPQEDNHGGGLGPSTALSIVHNHNGFIDVQSRVGAGTTFEVYLPVANPTLGEELEAPTEMLFGNGELILVVDDERTIREVISATLKSYNYRVLAAADGGEAIACFAQRGREIQAVIIDQVMPVISGSAAVQVLRKINRALPILMISGVFGEKQKEVEALRMEGVAFQFLHKPFTTQGLLTGLKTLLSEKAENFPQDSARSLAVA